MSLIPWEERFEEFGEYGNIQEQINKKVNENWRDIIQSIRKAETRQDVRQIQCQTLGIAIHRDFIKQGIQKVKVKSIEHKARRAHEDAIESDKVLNKPEQKIASLDDIIDLSLALFDRVRVGSVESTSKALDKAKANASEANKDKIDPREVIKLIFEKLHDRYMESSTEKNALELYVMLSELSDDERIYCEIDKTNLYSILEQRIQKLNRLVLDEANELKLRQEWENIRYKQIPDRDAKIYKMYHHYLEDYQTKKKELDKLELVDPMTFAAQEKACHIARLKVQYIIQLNKNNIKERLDKFPQLKILDEKEARKLIDKCASLVKVNKKNYLEIKKYEAYIRMYKDTFGKEYEPVNKKLLIQAKELLIHPSLIKLVIKEWSTAVLKNQNHYEAEKTYAKIKSRAINSWSDSCQRRHIELEYNKFISNHNALVYACREEPKDEEKIRLIKNRCVIIATTCYKRIRDYEKRNGGLRVEIREMKDNISSSSLNIVTKSQFADLFGFATKESKPVQKFDQFDSDEAFSRLDDEIRAEEEIKEKRLVEALDFMMHEVESYTSENKSIKEMDLNDLYVYCRTTDAALSVATSSFAKPITTLATQRESLDQNKSALVKRLIATIDSHCNKKEYNYQYNESLSTINAFLHQIKPLTDEKAYGEVQDILLNKVENVTIFNPVMKRLCIELFAHNTDVAKKLVEQGRVCNAEGLFLSLISKANKMRELRNKGLAINIINIGSNKKDALLYRLNNYEVYPGLQLTPMTQGSQQTGIISYTGMSILDPIGRGEDGLVSEWVNKINQGYDNACSMFDIANSDNSNKNYYDTTKPIHYMIDFITKHGSSDEKEQLAETLNKSAAIKIKYNKKHNCFHPESFQIDNFKKQNTKQSKLCDRVTHMLDEINIKLDYLNKFNTLFEEGKSLHDLDSTGQVARLIEIISQIGDDFDKILMVIEENTDTSAMKRVFQGDTIKFLNELKVSLNNQKKQYADKLSDLSENIKKQLIDDSGELNVFHFKGEKSLAPRHFAHYQTL